MDFYDKEGNKVDGNEDNFTIGMKHNGQGYITMLLDDRRHTFTFFALNEDVFLICMKNIWKVANEPTLPS